MKTKFALIALLCLTACKTDSQVRSAPPLNTYMSDKAPNKLVACLTTSLPERWNASPAMMNQRFVGQVINPDQEYDIVPVDSMVNGHYSFTINVKGQAAGSAIHLFKGQFMLPGITRAMQAAIQDCV